MQQTNHEDESSQPSDALALPGWLRARHSADIQAAREEVEREARQSGAEVGVIADRRVRAILADCGARDTPPSAATVAAYWRDHSIMMEEQQTPLDKATTFQHHNRLRSAFRFCEVEVIKGLRAASEIARRAKDYEKMKRLTAQALERASAFDALFLSDGRPTWGAKAAALRAAGDGTKPTGKSKRAAGRVAPSPDQLLVALADQPGRCSRVEVPALCFALFGVRPAELLLGAQLVANGEALSLIVRGAKVDAVRGQKERTLTIAPAKTATAAGFGKSVMAVRLLREAVEAGKGWVQLTDALLASVRRAMRGVQAGLSPYAYRHARASDAKATQDRATVAAWMGHSTDRAQSGYGSGRSGSGAVKVKAAHASAPVRLVKTLPASMTAKAQATRHAKIAARTANPPTQSRAPQRKGPRPR